MATAKDWLDHNGYLLFGKYKGELVSDIACRDPGYLRWIIDDPSRCCAADETVIRATLRRYA